MLRVVPRWLNQRDRNSCERMQDAVAPGIHTRRWRRGLRHDPDRAQAVSDCRGKIDARDIAGEESRREGVGDAHGERSASTHREAHHHAVEQLRPLALGHAGTPHQQTSAGGGCVFFYFWVQTYR